MARKPRVIGEGEKVKRTVEFPGELYNQFVRAAEKDRRGVTAQLHVLMEEYVRETEKKERQTA